MPEPVKRLYRSRSESKLGGVCGGLAVHFGVDPVLMRVLWVVGTCVTGFAPGIVAYLAAWFIMPEEPRATTASDVAPHGHRSET
jgi:phage shock protein C